MLARHLRILSALADEFAAELQSALGCRKS